MRNLIFEIIFIVSVAGAAFLLGRHYGVLLKETIEVECVCLEKECFTPIRCYRLCKKVMELNKECEVGCGDNQR